MPVMKIYIITAKYNSATHIADCFASINNQTRQVNHTGQGIYDAMNKGIKMATGDIVGTLNSDDTFYDSSALEKIVEAFEENPEIKCLYGNLVFTNESNKVVRKWQSEPFVSGLFAKSWSLARPTFYCRREVFRKYGLYKTNYKIAADVEFMLRVMEVQRIKSYYLNKTLVRMSMGGVSTSGLQSTVTITREMRRAFKENGLPFNLPKYVFYKALKLREFL